MILIIFLLLGNSFIANKYDKDFELEIVIAFSNDILRQNDSIYNRLKEILMEIEFVKYHGTGNDFIIIDDYNKRFEKLSPNKKKTISAICNRNIGVGADGLILLQKSKTCDFKMKYYNSDGKEGSMCGNGGRSIAAFAFHHGYASKQMTFEAIDGEHYAEIIDVKDLIKIKSDPAKKPKVSKPKLATLNITRVKLKMRDITICHKLGSSFYVNTGSPHYIEFVKEIEKFNVKARGAKIRNSRKFQPYGTNVSFVEIKKKGIFCRTFERGVESETLSCGTAAVAVATALYINGKIKKEYKINTKGGQLLVNISYALPNKIFEDVWLTGPTELVYKGVIGKNLIH